MHCNHRVVSLAIQTFPMANHQNVPPFCVLCPFSDIASSVRAIHHPSYCQFQALCEAYILSLPSKSTHGTFRHRFLHSIAPNSENTEAVPIPNGTVKASWQSPKLPPRDSGNARSCSRSLEDQVKDVQFELGMLQHAVKEINAVLGNSSLQFQSAEPKANAARTPKDTFLDARQWQQRLTGLLNDSSREPKFKSTQRYLTWSDQRRQNLGLKFEKEKIPSERRDARQRSYRLGEGAVKIVERFAYFFGVGALRYTIGGLVGILNLLCKIAANASKDKVSDEDYWGPD